MAHSINLDWGAGTILLNSGNYRLLEYTPSTNFDAREITETARFEVSGTAAAVIQAGMQSINTAFRLARDCQAGRALTPVYIVYQPDGLAASGRSELLDARIILDKDAMGPLWREKAVQFSISWKRRNWWEGAEAQVPLSNENGTATTDALTVYNCSDGAVEGISDYRVNYAEIDGSSISGDLPAACRIELTNTFNDAGRTGSIQIAHNVNSDPANMPHILEGEDSTIGTTTSAVDAASGGAYQTCAAWSGTTETALWQWTLPSTLLDCTRGHWMRLIARFAAAPTEYVIRLRVKILIGSSVIFASPPVVLDYQINQELVSLQLPPYLQPSGVVYPVTLQITGEHEEAGSHTLALDFLQISPVDGWRSYRSTGFDLEYNARLVDDGVERRLYTDNHSTAGQLGNYIAAGQPILLEPGRKQRLYFLWGTWTGGADITETAGVKVYYRPRKAVL